MVNFENGKTLIEPDFLFNYNGKGISMLHIGSWVLWLYGLIFGIPIVLLLFIIYKMPTVTGKLAVLAIGIVALLFLVKWVFVL